ncbi:MAG: 30S ribosomal protein S6 [Bacteroidetes bacterium]|jgi:small subunit ribosomal protein S6|nr:30S ribosomal protein S6 [Bacteroidota bacterium]MBX7239017.1 30S ribosomal protein S6 [Bacteroidia bacterium]MCC7513084.1 30S ribosomal protein S6 [Bacteroidia bacterium]MCW5919618.1 30S ribosomal protein S6 [Bacteroidota bacterium]HMU78353.1 30S ribosomal protein S6 [Bacteroidia bacterium]
MSNQYETVFILTPVLSNEQMNEAVDKFRKILTDNGAMIVHENNWGLRKLAYPIQKKNTGFYYLIEFKSSGELINKLEVEYKRDERVMRFLTVALDKHAIAYNEKKRKNAELKKKEQETATAN